MTVPIPLPGPGQHAKPGPVPAPAKAIGAAPPPPYDDVRCPRCLGLIHWDGEKVYDLTVRPPVQVELEAFTDPFRRAEAIAKGFVRCSHSTDDFEHFLPVEYLRYEQPLFIGFVGMGSTGKTTLLAAMLRELDLVGLARHGLKIEALDRNQNREFEENHIKPLFEQGLALEATRVPGQGLEFVAAYRVEHASGVRPVAFFDVSGEQLLDDRSPYSRFMHATEALVFLVDPELIELNRAAGGDPKPDETFRAVLDRVTRVRRAQGLGPVAASVVLVKADLHRFEPVVEKWLNLPAAAPLDAGMIREESRDVYAFLHQLKAAAWLWPVGECSPCTLHVVTATGGRPLEDADGQFRYPRGPRPRRVLEPLVALLAMTGVIASPGADLVGR